MEFKEMDYLKEDLERYFSNCNNIFSKFKIIVRTQGIWATIVFRAGSWCHKNKKKKWPIVILPFLTIIQTFVESMTGIVLPFTAEIGKGLYIGHFGCIILNPDSIIGNYCNISNGNTIGQAGRGGIQKTPVIGNRVYIAPGAKIFGGIEIGNNVAIGANAVVTKSLPENSVAVGNPAKIINYKGSSDFIVVK